MACFPWGLGLAWLWAFLSFSPLLAPSIGLLVFLPCRFIILATVLFDPHLLGHLLGLLYALFSISYNDQVLLLGSYSCHFGVFLTHYIARGLLGPFLPSRASLAHFSFLGHPQPISFPLGILGPFPTLYSHEFLLTLLAFPSPITISFILRVHGLSINPLLSYFITSGLLWPILTFLHHIIPMGLLLLSLGSFRPICFPQGPFIYLMGLWPIVPAIRVIWVFLSIH